MVVDDSVSITDRYAMTVKDRFPIPAIDELLDELYGTQSWIFARSIIRYA